MNNLTLAQCVRRTVLALDADAQRLCDPLLTQHAALLHRQLNTVANQALSAEDAASVGAVAGTPQPEDGGTPKNPA